MDSRRSLWDDEAYSLAAELPCLQGSGRRRYVLRVVGQSMIGAHIADGDLLVVEEDEAPPDGEVVVALPRGWGRGDGQEALPGRGERQAKAPENGDHEDLDPALRGRRRCRAASSTSCTRQEDDRRRAGPASFSAIRPAVEMRLGELSTPRRKMPTRRRGEAADC